MKKSLVTLLCMLASYGYTQAQTTLSAGDVMFVGVNSDNVGTSPYFEEIALLFLEPVTTGTELYITDMGYIGNSSPYFLQNQNNGCSPGNGAAGDGMVKWTATSNVSAGTQLLIRINTAGGLSASTGTITGIVDRNSSTGVYISLPGGGDELFVFQGTLNGSNQVTSATVLSALNYESAWTSVTNCVTISGSADPSTGYDVFFSPHEDNGYYSGSMTGSKAALQAAISNFANWTVDPDPVTLPISGSFSLGASTTTWNGTTWNNGAPDASTDAIIAGTVPTGSFTCADLTINSGYGLVFNANQTVNVNGNVTNNGLGFIAAASTAVVNFASSGSLSGNAQTYSGQITVASGATLTTNNLLTLTAPSSSSYGTIGQSAGTISGNVTVQRFVPGKRAFRFMGHPFSSAVALTTLTDDIDITGTGGSANGFTNTQQNNPSAFWWDPTTGDNSTTGNNPGWTAFTNTNGSGANSWDQYELIRVMIRGQKGQGLSGGSYTPSDVTMNMTGVVNQGDQVVTLTKGSGSDFVACGNPFASGVQMNTVAKSGSIGANYYVWDATMAASGAYVTNAFTTSYVLPPFAALFTTASATGTLTFEEADKATGGSGLFKGTTAEQNWVELLISDSNTKWDRLMIHLDDNAMDLEDNQDAVKLYNPNLDFFTLSKDGQRLAIDVRPYSDGAAIPLGLTAYNRYNKYVIKTGNFDIPAGAKLFLHDKYLNTKTELGTGVEYWFDVTSDTASQGNNRFEINMVGKTTGIASTLNTAAKMQLVPNPAHNEVKVSFTQLEGAAHLQLTSVTGRVVYSEVVNAASGSVTIPLQAIPAGMYIVELQSTNARFAEKLIKK